MEQFAKLGSKFLLGYQVRADEDAGGRLQNYTLEVWDIKNQTIIQTRSFNSSITRHPATHQTMSSDKNILLLSYLAWYADPTQDVTLSKIEIINTTTLETETEWIEKRFDYVDFSPDSKYLLIEFSFYEDSKIYSVPNFEQILEFSLEGDSIGWIRESQLLVHTSGGNYSQYTDYFTFYQIDENNHILVAAEEFGIYKNHTASVLSASLSKDEQYIVFGEIQNYGYAKCISTVACSKTLVEIYEIQSGELVYYDSHENMGSSVYLPPTIQWSSDRKSLTYWFYGYNNEKKTFTLPE